MLYGQFTYGSAQYGNGNEIACPNKKITCPNCKSDNVKKIGAGSKVVAGALFRVFAMGKISKTWQCNKCKFKW